MSDTAAERTVAPKQLIALVRDASTKREQIAEIAGALGERVKNAVENGNLHRGAFAVMVRLNKMDEQKRNDFIRAFGLYTDHCEKELWGGKHTGDLVDLADVKRARDKQAESEKNAAGIKQLEPEKHAENQKPKRGRQTRDPVAAAAKAEDALVEEAEADGLVAWNEKRGAVVPDKYAGSARAREAWLDAWRGGQVQAEKARDAATFDAGDEAKKPHAALPGAEAAGSYQTH